MLVWEHGEGSWAWSASHGVRGMPDIRFARRNDICMLSSNAESPRVAVMVRSELEGLTNSKDAGDCNFGKSLEIVACAVTADFFLARR